MTGYMVQDEQPKSIFKIPLVREIAMILLIKLAVVIVIKWQFFSAPLDLMQANNSVEHQMGLPVSKTLNLNLEKNDG
jgi:hypothetical protein